ncbi:hypothetical protein Naga_100097g11 [Nannochloropsis gaditana]|uniref:Uncharacterized protein n=1 Tax=Nannochloropsis gaditana TaxID=72520 RepID=W7U2C6_9STRA|nr:hypothetical protein Naga_100097g11 [Nannochloropsis gaditana]
MINAFLRDSVVYQWHRSLSLSVGGTFISKPFTRHIGLLPVEDHNYDAVPCQLSLFFYGPDPCADPSHALSSRVPRLAFHEQARNTGISDQNLRFERPQGDDCQHGRTAQKDHGLPADTPIQTPGL